MQTRSFKLHYGVDHGGVTHVDVELGPTSVAAYLRLHPTRPGADATDVERVRYTCEGLSARIRRLGDIRLVEVTGEFLVAHLQMPDLDLLLAHAEALDVELDRFRRGVAADAQAPVPPRVDDGVVGA